MERKAVVAKDSTGDQVFVDDLLEHGRSATVIPGRLRVDYRDRTAHTHPQAVHLAAIDQALRLHQAKLFQPPFEKLPSFDTCRRVTASRL
jgi:hypothetical protein